MKIKVFILTCAMMILGCASVFASTVPFPVYSGAHDYLEVYTSGVLAIEMTSDGYFYVDGDYIYSSVGFKMYDYNGSEWILYGTYPAGAVVDTGVIGTDDLRSSSDIYTDSSCTSVFFSGTGLPQVVVTPVQLTDFLQVFGQQSKVILITSVMCLAILLGLHLVPRLIRSFL